MSDRGLDSEHLKLGKHIQCVPIIHGRAIFAQEVRRIFLEDRYQCIAVELPATLRDSVLEAVRHLPLVTAVVYQEKLEDYCYIPVEPGEAIIEALRLGQEERAVLEFVDLDTPFFEAPQVQLPDEYAIKTVGLEKYYRSVLPVLNLVQSTKIQQERERWMAMQLRDLDEKFSKILFVCGMAHLEGIKKYFYGSSKKFRRKVPKRDTKIYAVHSDNLYFLMGEIPYITFLYEQSRYKMEIDQFDKTDGLKNLLLETRKEYCRDFPEEIDRLTPAAMQSMLTYLRNLCLIQGGLTPSMYDLAVAAQGVGGGGYGAKVVDMAKFYPYQDPLAPFPVLKLAMEKGWLPMVGEVKMKNRLPGPPFSLKKLRLEPMPRKEKKEEWKRHWGGYSECSWPDEDEKIENFTNHVKQRALGVLGEDQAKVDKFTTSIKDGIDLRETLRQWHTGNIYIKELPPSRGDVGAVLFIFDSDIDRYPWRSTWLAEHENESTLCFYATPYREDMVGPGIGRAYYGGALFIFPPIIIPNIWTDKRFLEVTTDPLTLMVLAALEYSHSKYIAYVSGKKPTLEMRKLERKMGKHLIYLPLSSFSTYTLRKLRKFHVLQGHQIRSYAQKYIR